MIKVYQSEVGNTPSPSDQERHLREGLSVGQQPAPLGGGRPPAQADASLHRQQLLPGAWVHAGHALGAHLAQAKPLVGQRDVEPPLLAVTPAGTSPSTAPPAATLADQTPPRRTLIPSREKAPASPLRGPQEYQTRSHGIKEDEWRIVC